MKKVIDGCPYCGSKDGFQQKETVTRYLYFDQYGVPDSASEDYGIDKMSWSLPRCCACGKKVKMDGGREYGV